MNPARQSGNFAMSSSPSRLERLSTVFRWLSFFLVPISLGFVFVYAPMEREMGISQRIFYYHVPSAFLCFTGFFLVFLGSALYLLTRQTRWDRLAGVAAELGIVFCAIVLITGPLWAKPAWGVYWTWDIRLTTTLVMFLMYSAYWMLKVSAQENPQRATFSAIYGILCVFNIPLVHFSVRYFQSVHPHLFRVEGNEGSALTPEMWWTFWISQATVACLFAWIFTERLRLAELEDEMEEVRERVRAQMENSAGR